MADKRLVSSEMFEDDFFITLNFFQRLLWIGIIAKCADDQGRLLDNASIIKSKVFPADNVNTEEVSECLDLFCKDEKIHRYSDGKKNLIQIVNWWKHQNPQWPAPSNYEAPQGWIDRIKHHLPGNKVYSLNWESKGGFVNSMVDPNLEAYLASKVDPNLDSEERRQDGVKDRDGDGVKDGIKNINREPAKTTPVAESEFDPPPEKIPKVKKHKYGEFQNVLLSEEDIQKLKEKFPDSWKEKIQTLSEGKEMKGYKYKSDYLAIIKWAQRDQPEKKPNSTPVSQPAKRSFAEVIEERNRLRNDQQRNSNGF